MTNVVGQNKLFLEHKSKLGKKKYLDLSREYHIQTIDTAYSYKKIVAFTDSTISITTWTKTDRDTLYFYSYSISNIKDTTYSQTQPIYKLDTIAIAFTDIKTLKKDWFKNRKWLEPFGWVAVGAVLGVAMLPVAVIDKGKEGFKEWAVFETVLIGISIPPIFIGTRKTKYDLKKKWKLRMGN